MKLPQSLVAALLSISLLVACGRASDDAPSGPGAAAMDVNSPEFKKRVQERQAQMDRDEAVIEEAPWFGQTGLPADVERELPRYLRREHGRLLSEPGALKAADLAYLGAFPEGAVVVHYWRINDGLSNEPAHAYVEVSAAGDTLIGWGGRQPPQGRN
jgi:hypothetical protein